LRRFFFQAEDGIRGFHVTGVQTCALPIWRVVRSQDDVFERIVEQKDATPAELEVDEINSGIYCFETQKLFAALAKVSNENAQGEIGRASCRERVYTGADAVSRETTYVAHA